jgi:hypothetical protein
MALPPVQYGRTADGVSVAYMRRGVVRQGVERSGIQDSLQRLNLY